MPMYVHRHGTCAKCEQRLNRGQLVWTVRNQDGVFRGYEHFACRHPTTGRLWKAVRVTKEFLEHVFSLSLQHQLQVLSLFCAQKTRVQHIRKEIAAAQEANDFADDEVVEEISSQPSPTLCLAKKKKRKKNKGTSFSEKSSGDRITGTILTRNEKVSTLKKAELQKQEGSLQRCDAWDNFDPLGSFWVQPQPVCTNTATSAVETKSHNQNIKKTPSSASKQRVHQKVSKPTCTWTQSDEENTPVSTAKNPEHGSSSSSKPKKRSRFGRFKERPAVMSPFSPFPIIRLASAIGSQPQDGV